MTREPRAQPDAIPEGVVRGADGAQRCAWGASHPLYVPYHDREWGFPVADDARLLEKLCLEGFQSGLSWLTILKKRDAFRAAFSGFDIDAVAAMTGADVARLLDDARIVRHRGKIEATVANARAARRVRDAFGSFAAYVWRFEPPRRRAAAPWRVLRARGQTPESRAFAADLKRRGFRFVGPTTAYAFMQAIGLVNDHATGCDTWARAEAAARRFSRPR